MNIIRLDKSALDNLTRQLEDAYRKYKESYNALEEGIMNLTSKGFTGDAAPVFMKTFTDKVKPTGEKMEEIVQRTITLMEEETAHFNSRSANMSDISRM